MNKFVIPDTYKLRQTKLLQHSMKLLEKKSVFGYIKQKKTHGVIQFHLYDKDMNQVALGRKKFLQLGASVEIYDMFGGLMGSIQHQIHNPLHQPLQKYAIYDAYGKLMSQTKSKIDMGHAMTLYQPKGQKVLSLQKKLTVIKKKWQIQTKQGVDKRLAIFLPMFVSSQLKQIY